MTDFWSYRYDNQREKRTCQGPCRYTRKVYCPERLYQGRIKNINKEGLIKIGNINEGGVFIETEMSFSGGQVISMTYSSPQFGERNRIGKIIWISSHGFGVKFEKP
jgi:hypothetical protein